MLCLYIQMFMFYMSSVCVLTCLYVSCVCTIVRLYACTCYMPICFRVCTLIHFCVYTFICFFLSMRPYVCVFVCFRPQMLHALMHLYALCFVCPHVGVFAHLHLCTSTC